MIDWRTIEDEVLRRMAKADYFRELYGGGSAERAPVLPVSGRLVVRHPPMHFPRVERVEPRIL
jgi:hypothetical protein